MTPTNMTQGDRVRDTGLKAAREREREEGGGGRGVLPAVEKRRRGAKNCQGLSSP